LEKSRNHLLATLRKSEGEEVRIELCDFKGAHFLGVRVWARTEAGMRPTKSGLTVSMRLAEPLMFAIQQALTESAQVGPQAELFPVARRQS
jgi:hypothetical protein